MIKLHTVGCVKMWKVHNSENIKLDLVTEFILQKLQPNIGVMVSQCVPDRFWQSL